MKPILFILFIVSSFTVYSEQVNKDTPIQTVIDAKKSKHSNPDYPESEQRSGKEGWVQLSYIIEKDGTVSNPIIQDSSGAKSFEKSAIRAVKEWEFSPATLDGESIQQCRNKVMFQFTMHNTAKGGTRRFRSKYNEINDLIDEGNLTAARTKLDELKSKPQWNLYEDTFFWYLKSQYHLVSNEEDLQLKSLLKITNTGKTYLPSSTYESVLKSIFVLYLRKNHLTDALDTFEALQENYPDSETITLLAPYAAQAKNILNSDQPLNIEGKIDDSYYSHQLNKSSFSFANVKGDLYNMDIRCNNQRSTYSAEEGKTWNIPKQWGRCSIFVYGNAGTTFNLIET